MPKTGKTLGRGPEQSKAAATATTTLDDYLGVALPPEEPDGGEGEGESGSEDGREEALQENLRDGVGAVDTAQRRKQQQKHAKKAQLAAQKEAIEKEKALNESPEDAYSVKLSSQPDPSAIANARDIKVEGFSVAARGKDLLLNTSLTISHGHRYGLVGPNGKGKTSLMKLLVSKQLPVPESMDVLMVEQEVHADKRSALSAVIESDAELVQLRNEERELRSHLDKLSLYSSSADVERGHHHELADHANEDDEAAESVSSRLDEVYDQLEQRGSSRAEASAARILSGLGFTKSMQQRTTNTFSGGWRMRISLARALFMQPSLLLLDEPTNHLDLRAVLWLEEYLQRWKKTLVVVSHDRDFLNTVSTDIIHLHDQKLDFYRGNFVQFEQMYEQRKREANKKYEKYEKQMKEAKKSGSKDKQKKVDERIKEQSKQKSKGKSKHQTDNEDSAGAWDAPRKWHDYHVKFEFPEPTELSPPLIQMQDAKFQYPNRDDFVMQDLNLGIDMQSRIAVVGANGSGKTTLMNLIAGDLEPTEGFCKRNQKLRVGRYSQHFIDQLDFQENPVEYLQNRFSHLELKPEHLRKRLGKFGLPGNNHLTPIMKLSGGQKARVIFTSIALSEPHILLLDEPTNHLDMQSIDALSEALDAFDGGVVIISHDSRLLATICSDEEHSEVWDVQDGVVRRYDSDFEDYKEELMEAIREEFAEEDEEQGRMTMGSR
jgi:ATP-binding cassette subfamily F protein 1